MLKFKEEFSEIVEFFNTGEEINLGKFKAALEEAIKFSEKLKDKIIHGTQEEKEELKDFLQEMQTKIEDEKNKLFQKIGISEEELKAYIGNKDNFSETEWSAMQEMKSYIKENVESITNEHKKAKKTKAKWLQS